MAVSQKPPEKTSLKFLLIIGRDINCTVVRTQNISVRISPHHPSYKPKIEN